MRPAERRGQGPGHAWAASVPTLIDERDIARLLLADPNVAETEAEVCQLALGAWPLDADRRSALEQALIRHGYRSPY
jgi:hypothetical protein